MRALEAAMMVATMQTQYQLNKSITIQTRRRRKRKIEAEDRGETLCLYSDKDAKLKQKTNIPTKV